MNTSIATERGIPILTGTPTWTIVTSTTKTIEVAGKDIASPNRSFVVHPKPDTGSIRAGELRGRRLRWRT